MRLCFLCDNLSKSSLISQISETSPQKFLKSKNLLTKSFGKSGQFFCQEHCVKCAHSEFFWSVFSRIRTEYGDLCESPYLVRLRENTDEKNSKYRNFNAVEGTTQ